MKERLALAVTASLVIGAGVPAGALEPVDGPDANGPPVVCPNPWDGGSCLGPLPAGTYRTTVFETPFTFTVPDGWANYEDLPGNFLLLPPGGDIYGVDAGTSDYVGVFLGVGLGANSGTNCDAVDASAGLDPASMVAALAAREGIVVSDPVPVEIGGLSGLMIDIADDPSSDAGCRDPEVPFAIKGVIAGLGPLRLSPSDFAHGIGPGFTMRLYLLDRGDTNVVIEVDDVTSAPGTADDYQSVIDTIEFSIPDPTGRIAFGRIVDYDDFYGQVVALYAIDPDGSDLVQLTDGDSAFPAWSPDGTRLAYTQRQPDGTWQIATIAADGSDLRVLTTGAGVSEAPSWSPDGTWIAYDHAPTFPTDDTWHTSLYRMDADGSDPTLLGDPEMFDVEPQVASDGNRVLFTRLTVDDAGQHGQLVIRELTSGEESAIDAVGDAVEHPKWSPDGQSILYVVGSWMPGAGVPQDQIERIAADGSGEPEIIVAGTSTQRGVKPAYSPDSRHIVFGCPGAAGDNAVCLADADGTNVITLVDEPGVEENHFSWGVGAQ